MPNKTAENRGINNRITRADPPEEEEEYDYEEKYKDVDYHDGKTTGSGNPTQTSMRTASARGSFAANGPQHGRWMLAVGIQWEGQLESNNPVLAHFEGLKQLELPQEMSGLTSIVVPELLVAVKACAEQRPELLNVNDPFFIAKGWNCLAAAYHRICTAVRDDENEAHLRRGVDEVIDMVFTWGPSPKLKIKFEEKVQLCRTEEDAMEQEVPLGHYAVADTLIVAPARKGMLESVYKRARREKVQSSLLNNMHWQHSEPMEISLIVFACEYSPGAATISENQIIYDLAAAQMQRRALGLPSQSLMGACCSKDSVRFISVWWNEDSDPDALPLSAYLHRKEFQLTNPIHFINLYTLLCKLASTVENLGDEVGGDLAMTVEAIRDNAPWRATRKSSKKCKTRANDEKDEAEMSARGRAVYNNANLSPALSLSLTADMLESVPQESTPLPQRVQKWQLDVTDDIADDE